MTEMERLLKQQIEQNPPTDDTLYVTEDLYEKALEAVGQHMTIEIIKESCGESEWYFYYYDQQKCPPLDPR